MKKLIYLVMLLLLSTTALASSETFEVNNVEYTSSDRGSSNTLVHTQYLNEGWNLIPFGEGVEMGYSQDFEKNLMAAYVYHPYDRVFYDIMDDDNELEYLVDKMGYTSIWVYMEDDTKIKIEVDSEDIAANLQSKDFYFDDGWNFYTLLPQMQKNYPGPHFNIHERDNTYYIESMYIWNQYDQNWEYVYDEFIEWENQEDDLMVYPVLIKYWNDFRPEFKSSEIEIPAFPYN